MDLDQDGANTDEYFLTALQIFDYCGGESTGTLRVDALMDKFAPFVKTNKAEYSYLRSLLDPEQSNPEITATKLANALNKYSESQKSKVDLEESFNLKTGPMPQDSDSGISTDGFQLLEDLQCELREKSHLAHKLRSQLDFTDRQHEEALATLTAERDSLRAHLNMLREENITLTHVRRDYEEACDRLCGSEQALDEARRELDALRKCCRVRQEQVATLETEKFTLQELLTKSKDECHRMNEMYASRQSALLEENETLKSEHADLSARLQDQDEVMQQIIKEKVLLEMELKDMLNKSNQTQLRFDRSIDVSYTEEQMLSALDSLNADSRFAPDNQLLDEESFINALKEEQGRATNVSLFDEIRMSFSNISRQQFLELNDTQCDKCNENMEQSFITIGTQTDEGYNECGVCDPDVRCECPNTEQSLKPRVKSIINVATQTRENIIQNIGNFEQKTLITIATQTKEEPQQSKSYNNNACAISDACPKCHEYDKLHNYSTQLEIDLKRSRTTITELQFDLDKYEENLNVLQNFLDEGNNRNQTLKSVVQSLQSKLDIFEAACASQRDRIELLSRDTACAECQTFSDQTSVSTQVEVPCVECEKRNAVVPHRSLRKYLWEPLKCLFQVFAVICFVCAVCVLYSASRRWSARCQRDARAAVPWRWLDAHDLMDLLLRIEYVADVPM